MEELERKTEEKMIQKKELRRKIKEKLFFTTEKYRKEVFYSRNYNGCNYCRSNSNNDLLLHKPF